MSFATGSSSFGLRPAGTFGGFGTGATSFGASGATNQPQQPQQQGTNIFGQPQQQQQQPQQNANPSPFGAFGQQSQQQQQQQQQQPQQQQAGGFFGQPGQQQQPQNQQQQQPLGLFGQGQAQQPQQQQSGGLFGQSTAQPQQSTGFFGQQPQQQQQQQQNTGLFGQSARPTGLFGQPQQQQQQQQPQQPQQQQPGLFGQSTQGTGFFGASQAPQPAASGTSFFGQPQQSQPGAGTGLFGGAGPGASMNAPAASASAPAPTLPFNKNTKFNDLPDEIKRIFEEIDTHIQGRIHIASDLKSRALGEEIEKGSIQLRAATKQFQDVSMALQQDEQTTSHFKTKLDECIQDAIAATRIVEGFRNQQTSGAYLKNYASFPFEYFSKVTRELKERLEWYKATLEQIERKITLSASRTQYTPQGIAATLQAQHATFIALADKTSQLHGELERIKNVYREQWRSKTGSRRDPFEGGLGSLAI